MTKSAIDLAREALRKSHAIAGDGLRAEITTALAALTTEQSRVPDREQLIRRLGYGAITFRRAPREAIDMTATADMLDEAAAALALPAVGDWRDIDEMPKDGTRFEAWPGLLAEGPAVVIAWWYVHPSVSGWITDAYDCGDYEFAPTHGRFLPAPPIPEEPKP